MWPLNNKKNHYYKPKYNASDKFLLAKLKKKKKCIRGVNFINLKNSGGYIAKLKPQEICLQMT